METFLIFYLVIINIVTFFVYFLDKHNAQKKLYRVSEKALITLALVGGSLGALFAMYIFRHKTKHLFFTLSVPIILFLQIVITKIVFFS